MDNARILIVDDNKAIHEDFKKILVAKNDKLTKKIQSLEDDLFGETAKEKPQKITVNFELDHAFQGQEALSKASLAHNSGKPFSIIFMDVRMPPGWDGITTIEKIVEQANGAEFVICSAYSDFTPEEIVDRIGEKQNIIFLKKPFRSAEVIEVIQALLNKRAKVGK